MSVKMGGFKHSSQEFDGKILHLVVKRVVLKTLRKDCLMKKIL